MKRNLILSLMLLACVICFSPANHAQTTEFSYQGSLKDNAVPANGNYDFEFALFDLLSGGSQIGATIPKNNVLVTNGIISVKLDFGSVFPGADRYLEIHVRLVGQPGFTTLTPRQIVTSIPYSVKTLTADNAIQLSGIAASGFIQNGTALQTANQNISGNAYFGGRVGIGTTAPISKLHITSEAGDSPPRLQSSGTTDFSAGWDFYLGVAGKGYVGVGGSNASFAPGELILFGGTGTKTSLWANQTRALTADTNGNVGIGTASPVAKLTVIRTDLSGGSDIAIFGQSSISSGIGVKGFVANGVGVWGTSQTASGLYGESGSGYGIYAKSNTAHAGYFDGPVRVGFTSNGIFQACYTSDTTTAGGTLALCSSSLRYKKDLEPFNDGLTFVNQLRPIAFKWKSNDMLDIGFGAEDVAKIDPRFVTYNDKGKVEGVKYDRLSVAFVNAFKEQQSQIESQAMEISEQKATAKAQQAEINGMRSIICSIKPEEVTAIEPLLATYNKTGQIEGVKYGQLTTVLVNAVKEQQTQIEAQQTLIDELRRKGVESQNQVKLQEKLLDRQQEELKKQRAEIDAMKVVICFDKPSAGICREN